jgi:NADH-quinone oxidoreductase subunit N
MEISTLQALAAGNSWSAIFPEIAVGCLALALLGVGIVCPKRAGSLVPGIAIAGILAILISVWSQPLPVGREVFDGLIRQGRTTRPVEAFFLLATLLVFVLARTTLTRQRAPRVEFYHIVLVVTGALMLLAQSNHFAMLFVALETVTIGFYILVSYFRESSSSLEAGLKYLILGALSSALLLFGIALLYGAAGNPFLPGRSANPMRFEDLAGFLAANPHNFMASVGVVLVIAGIAFKIGAFPFQIWIPDVYQGAPTPVTAFLAVSSKAAGFIVLLALTQRVFPAYGWLVTPVLSVMAGATILFGNLAALTQHNVKRLIGLSGVSHAGFLLVGVVAAARVPLAVGAVYFYLFAYLIASFAVFGVMAHMGSADDADQDLSQYAGLAKENPFLAGVLAVGLGSLAGIPPLAGFLGKLFIFVAAFEARLYGLLAVAVAGVVISIYYYFGWIRAAFFESWRPAEDAVRPARPPVGVIATVAMLALALASVALGFCPGPFGHWLGW